MSEDWVARARANLLRNRDRQGVWGYRSGTGPAVEPTSLAALALQLGPGGRAADEADRAVRRAADWLAAIQQPDGSLASAPAVPRVGWPTAYALIVWNRLGCHQGSRQRATAWLLAEQGRPMQQEGGGGQSPVFGHDPALVGWPWVEGTHSWVEPTALAVLALASAGEGQHARVAQGLRLLENRALPRGGWNYGNRSVFGRELRPQPGPTGLALLALSTATGAAHSPVVSRAVRYLRDTLPGVSAPISLGWGVLGLRAWDACPPEAADWLERSYSAADSHRVSTVGLGLLILAQREGKLLSSAGHPDGDYPS